MDDMTKRSTALSAAHSALDTATMANGMSDDEIALLSDMMHEIRQMLKSGERHRNGMLKSIPLG